MSRLIDGHKHLKYSFAQKYQLLLAEISLVFEFKFQLLFKLYLKYSVYVDFRMRLCETVYKWVRYVWGITLGLFFFNRTSSNCSMKKNK